METKKSILVIDDEPDAIEFVKAVLSNLGKFIIISAKDGEEGIELVKKHLPDLIIIICSYCWNYFLLVHKHSGFYNA